MLSILAFVLLSASSSGPTIESAQKAYVAGDWKRAAESFEAICPTLTSDKRTECALWGILSRSQTGDTKDFSRAKNSLDSLIRTTDTTLSVISDLYMTRAQFELYLGKKDASQKSLKIAYTKAKPKQYAVLFQVCQSLLKANPSDSAANLCKEIEASKMDVHAKSAPSSSSAKQEYSSSETKLSSSKDQSSSSEEKNSIPETKVSMPESSSSSIQTATSSSWVESSSSKANQKQLQAMEASSGWTLQLGAFSVKSNAETLTSNLKKRKINAKIVESKGENRTLYLVQTGTFSTKTDALDFGEKKLSPLKLEYQPVKKP
ncbi:MAG: SPOR domain-containing protein [Fibrobacteraceae bacterium]